MPRAVTRHASAPPRKLAQGSPLNALPEELLLLVFEQLAKVGPAEQSKSTAQANRDLAPFRAVSCEQEPHPGLRSYPFLGQVCRRWRALLNAPSSQDLLWKSLTVNFGHELMTSVHSPIEWSDRRPAADKFRASFSKTQLSSARLLAFVRCRAGCIRRLALQNGDGYWCEDQGFVSLSAKHDFSGAHMGLLLGLLQENLEELRVVRCNDMLGRRGTLDMLSCLPRLRRVHLEGLQMHFDPAGLARLGALSALEELSVTCDELETHYVGGLRLLRLPESWASLKNLRCLELRGHEQLRCLPEYLAAMPALLRLDISYNRSLDPSVVSKLTALESLSMQGLGLREQLPLQGGGGGVAQGMAFLAPPGMFAQGLQDQLVAAAPLQAGQMIHMDWLHGPPPLLQPPFGQGHFINHVGAVMLDPPPAHLPPPPAHLPPPLQPPAHLPPPHQPPPHTAQRLPNLAGLTALTSLELGDNLLEVVPPALGRLSRLVNLSLRDNQSLSVPQPLHELAALPNLLHVDLRGTHVEGLCYWTEAKCTTMRHVAAFSKKLRRRRPAARVLIDV